MIRIKKNKTPILPQCKFLCDGKLDKKLDDYELTRFLNCHSTTLFIGKPRSGKTSLLYSFFKSKKLLKQCFENIFLFQPRHSRASMKDKLFDQLHEDKKFDELVDVDRNVIDMMYIVRNLQFVADRDYKKGEKVSADCGMPYPAVLAACEFEFNRCKEGKDRTFYSITPDGVREYASLIKENNKDFVKHIDNLLSNKI